MSIELKNVGKNFQSVRAVEGVSFSVGDGELMALLGPSGGGKTTVLRLIAGLEAPDEGTISIGGKSVSHLPAARRNIGFVFQNYALFKNMTVFKNIAFGLKIKKWAPDRIAARVAELTGLLELHQLEERYPHQLSGGQRQRVAIARALAPQPSVLLLDEPFAAVDAQIRTELRQWLVRLHQELKLTTLFVTHDQEEAMEVSDRKMNSWRVLWASSMSSSFRSKPAWRVAMSWNSRPTASPMAKNFALGSALTPCKFRPTLWHTQRRRLCAAPIFWE